MNFNPLEQMKIVAPPKIINTVLTGVMNIEFETSKVMGLIPVFPVNLTVTPKNKTIPYFGHENKFVSIRTFSETKGQLRKVNTIKSFSDSDFQYGGRNIHFKISKKNISILGLKFKDNPENYFEVIINKIKFFLQEWKELYSLSQENVVTWTREFEDKLQLGEVTPKGIKNITWFTALDGDKYRFMKMMYMCLSDYEISSSKTKMTFTEYISNKFNNQCPYIPENIEELAVKTISICNTVYTFKFEEIPGFFCKIKKHKEEFSSAHFNLFHHNWFSGKKMQIIVSVDFIRELMKEPEESSTGAELGKDGLTPPLSGVGGTDSGLEVPEAAAGVAEEDKESTVSTDMTTVCDEIADETATTDCLDLGDEALTISEADHDDDDEDDNSSSLCKSTTATTPSSTKIVFVDQERKAKRNHIFNIRRKGFVSQTSPTNEAEATAAFDYLCKKLERIFD